MSQAKQQRVATFGFVSSAPPSALGARPFPAEHVVLGVGPQAQFLSALREVPVAGFSADDLGWERAPRSATAMKLQGVREPEWHLDPSELEP